MLPKCSVHPTVPYKVLSISRLPLLVGSSLIQKINRVRKTPKGAMEYNFVAINLGQNELAAFNLQISCQEVGELRNSMESSICCNKTRVTACGAPAKAKAFQSRFGVIGCNGAGSAVRRALYIPFEGHTSLFQG